MVQTLLGIIAMGICVGTTASAQGHGECTHEDAIQADKGLDSLSDWRHVYESFKRYSYESFKRYSHCDDGAIAEGYNDKVASLLVNHWDSVEELFDLWRADPQFGRFVLAHVDELMSPEQATTVIKNARKRCPPDSKKYCVSVERKAQALVGRGR